MLQKTETNLLILGGTGEAVELTDQLAKLNNWNIIYSVVGVTRNPILPDVNIRTGGFGGPDGLKNYLIGNNINILVDLTHPYATVISNSALTASVDCGISYVRYNRPEWTCEPKDHWIAVKDIGQAIAAIPQDSRVFLTIGRKDYPEFLVRRDVSFVVRVIEPPGTAADLGHDQTNIPVCKNSGCEQMKENVRFVVARPPFSLEQELQLLEEYEIEYLVTKNSGGEASYGKLVAARQLGVPVIIIDRPEFFGMDDPRLISDDVQLFDSLPGLMKWISQYN